MRDKSLRDQAHEVMLEQMKDNDNPNVELIHTYLCEATDEEVLAGIIKEGKSILGSIEFCGKKAREGKHVHKGVAQVASTTVFEWVEEYFKTDEPVKPIAKPIPKKEVKVKSKEEIEEDIAGTTAKYKEQIKDQIPKEKEGTQISLFDF